MSGCVIGPNDPFPLTPEQLAEAKEYTKAFNEFLGFKPASKTRQANDEKKLKAILAQLGFTTEED